MMSSSRARQTLLQPGGQGYVARAKVRVPAVTAMSPVNGLRQPNNAWCWHNSVDNSECCGMAGSGQDRWELDYKRRQI